MGWGITAAILTIFIIIPAIVGIVVGLREPAEGEST